MKTRKPGRPPLPKSLAKIREAKRLFSAGYTLVIIGAMLGVSTTTAYRLVTDGKGPTGRLTGRGPKPDQAKYARIRKFRGMGWTMTRIGKEVGISRQRVQQILSR